METTDKFIIHIKDNVCTYAKAMELVSRVIENWNQSPENWKHGFCYITVFWNPQKYAVCANGKWDTTTFWIYNPNYDSWTL